MRGNEKVKMMMFSQLNRKLFLGASILMLAACTSSTSAVDNTQNKKAEVSDTAKKAADAAKDAEAKTAPSVESADTEKKEDVRSAKIIRQPGAVADRGAYVKMVVNRNAVTNFDLNRRAAFLKLRRVPGNRKQLAEEEMIEQIIKLQEAQRRNVLATEAQVDDAFANFAKRNGATPSQLTGELNRLGVGANHFKSYIRTQMSWQRAVNGRFQAETTNLSEQDAIIQLRESGTAKPELTEYSFQQVVFVVPQDKQNRATLNARKREAAAFRQLFTTCDETVSKVKGLKDVSVINRSRIMEPELPDRWRSEMAALGGKGTTKAKETEKGVEFIAVCNSRVVNDDRAAQISTQSSEFESFNTKGTELSKRYLDQIKANATIIYK